MAPQGKGCRDWRPLIRSQCKGILKQDDEWKAELSRVPRRNFGGNWSRWSEFTAVFLRWICRAASLGKPLYVERKPFTVQLLNGPQGRDVTHILCKVSYFFFCWNPFIFVGYGNDLFFIPGAHLSIQILIFRILCNNVNVSLRTADAFPVVASLPRRRGMKNKPKQTIATLTRPFEILRYKKRKKTFSMWYSTDRN